AGIMMAKDTHGRIVVQHPPEAGCGAFGAIRHDDHARMLGITHSHTPAVMERDPCGTSSRIAHQVEERPVRYGIRAVLHRLGFTVRRGDRSAVEVVAPDNDRCFYFARLD